MRETDIASIFKHIYSVMRVHGVKNVMQKLKELQLHGLSDLNLKMMDFIVNEVVTIYEIDRELLLDGNRRGITSEARKVCYVVMYRELSLTEKQIAWYFKRHPKVVYRVMAEFSAMNPNIKWQKEFILKVQDISSRVSKELNRLSDES